MLLRASALLLIVGAFSPAWGDEIRPALLELVEQDDDVIEMTWKVPMKGGLKLALSPVLPESLRLLAPPTAREAGGGFIETARYQSVSGGLVGTTIGVDGLSGLSTDVLLRVVLRNGTEHTAVLRTGSLNFTVPVEPASSEVALSYWRMGTVHILEGYDHLLFLATLLLIVSGLWPLVKTVTAFTVAHSITLVLATLDVLALPAAPTEAVISLSIMLLAVEALGKSRGQTTLAETYPWVIAFAFGLVHGLGFAGALAEIGVPQNNVPLALLMFNVGVETGQLIFVLALTAVLALVRLGAAQGYSLLIRSAPYAIGGIAAFWTIERVAGFLA